MPDAARYFGVKLAGVRFEHDVPVSMAADIQENLNRAIDAGRSASVEGAVSLTVDLSGFEEGGTQSGCAASVWVAVEAASQATGRIIFSDAFREVAPCAASGRGQALLAASVEKHLRTIFALAVPRPRSRPEEPSRLDREVSMEMKRSADLLAALKPFPDEKALAETAPADGVVTSSIKPAASGGPR